MLQWIAATVPARTNDFQELVTLIETALAPLGAKVTPSAMVTVPGLTDPREIDVLIENGSEPFRMKVAYEAKDRKRRLSVTDVEGIIGKYTGEASIKVDKFVVVSNCGFTKGAREKAAAGGIELLTVAQAKDKKWENLPLRPISFGLLGNMQSGMATQTVYERVSNQGEKRLLHHFKGKIGDTTHEMLFTHGPPLRVVHEGPPPDKYKPPTAEAFAASIQSAFPDGITLKIGKAIATAKFGPAPKPDQPESKRDQSEPESKPVDSSGE